MKIISINTYNPYKNKNDLKTRYGFQIASHKLRQGNAFNPVFGNKDSLNFPMQEILNDKNLPDDAKNYFKELLEIDHFIDAAIAMNQDDLLMFIANGLYFKPLLEEVLKGNFIASYPNSNIEKPLLDLNAIAKYNRK